MSTAGKTSRRERGGLWLPLLVVVTLPASARSAQARDEQAGPAVAGAELASARRLFLEGKNAEAMALARRACELREQALGEGPELAEALGLLGDLQMRSGELAAAERTLQRSLAIHYARLGTGSPEAARSLNALGALYYVQGMHGRAQVRFERALAIREAALGRNDPEVARSLHNLANLFSILGMGARAEPLLLRELEIWNAAPGDRRAESARALTSLGNVYRLQGDLERARALFERALDLRRAALDPRHPDIARALSALADAERNQGQYAAAREHYQAALEIREAAFGPRHLEVARSFHDLGVLDWNERRYGSAGAFFERNIELHEEWIQEPRAFLAYSFQSLPHVYGEHGLYSHGEPFHDRGLALLERCLAENPFSDPQAFNAAQGLLGRVERLYLRAMEIHEAAFSSSHPLVAEDAFNLAGLYLVQGRYDRAEPFLRRWLAIGEAVLGADHPYVARSLFNLAQVLVVRDRVADALPLLERGVAIWEKHLRREAVDFSASRMSSYLQLFRDDGETIYQLLRERPDDARVRKLALTATLLFKGRSLEETAAVAGAISQSLSATDAGALGRLRALRTELAEQALEGPGPLSADQLQQRLKELASQCEALESDLARRSAPLRELGALPSAEHVVDQVAAALPEGSALVEFIAYRSRPLASKPAKPSAPELRYLALLLFPGGRTAAADLGPAAAVDKAAGDLRGALKSRDAAYLPVARALHDRVMQPLLPLLGGARYLFLAPDGQLNLVPFAALHDGRRFLIDAFDLAYVTSGKDLLPRSAELGAGRPILSDPAIVVMADPDYGPAPPAVGGMPPAWGALPGTRREAEFIRDLFPRSVRLLLGREARKDVLLTLEAPAILHLGTHAVFLDDASTSAGARAVVMPSEGFSAPLPDPLLRSLLLLAGAPGGGVPGGGAAGSGVVTALELAGMNLAGTQLVVLSACDTGMGEVMPGQGVYGLRRALFIAGAETVVMSLWHVNDDVTSTLMQRYYRNLAASRGRMSSLREAMLFVRARSPHPSFWAAFIAAGRDAPLSLPAHRRAAGSRLPPVNDRR